MSQKRQISILLAAALFFCAVLVFYSVFHKDPIQIYEVSVPSASLFQREELSKVSESGWAGGASAVSSSADAAKINLNTATLLQLITLPGIGEKTADAIIAYRTKNGGFSAPEDLMQVEGIGEKKFEQIKDRIIVK